MGALPDPSQSAEQFTTVQLDRGLFSEEAVLKACYWFSKEYSCEITRTTERSLEVTLKPRQALMAEALESTRDAFVGTVMDFALREKIEAKTSGIRDLLLAKAFSESGVLEDGPLGTFGDKIEEEKPLGMFKVLNNPDR